MDSRAYYLGYSVSENCFGIAPVPGTHSTQEQFRIVWVPGTQTTQGSQTNQFQGILFTFRPTVVGVLVYFDVFVDVHFFDCVDVVVPVC